MLVLACELGSIGVVYTMVKLHVTSGPLSTSSSLAFRQQPPTPADRSRSASSTIIYFGNDWSAENRTSSHHVAARLAERTRVLYVDSPGLRAPKANGRDLRKLVPQAAVDRAAAATGRAIACGR